MHAAKTMTMEIAELTRRCDAARGYVPRLPAGRPLGWRARRAMLAASLTAAVSLAALVGLLFLSAILDF